MAKFVDVGHSYRSTRCAVSRKVAGVVMHRVTYPFILFFQVLVVVYAANLLQLIAFPLSAGQLQFLVLAAYDDA